MTPHPAPALPYLSWLVRSAPIRRLLFILCFHSVTWAVHGAQVVADHDFEEPFVSFASGSGATGVLPEGWADASSADTLELEYSELREAPFAGAQSLLMELSAVEGGEALLLAPPLDLTQGELLRLRLAVRSPTNATMEVRLSSASDPTEIFWRQRVGAVPEWGLHTLLLAVPPGLVEGRFSLAVAVPGRLERRPPSLTALSSTSRRKTSTLP